MNPDDRIRLQHMRDAAREVISFGSNLTSLELAADRMRLLSIMKGIEIIGEAANKVTGATREALATIPWSDAVAMRNRLIHGYFDVDVEVIWQTLTGDIPRLLLLLDNALAE